MAILLHLRDLVVEHAANAHPVLVALLAIMALSLVSSYLWMSNQQQQQQKQQNKTLNTKKSSKPLSRTDSAKGLSSKEEQDEQLTLPPMVPYSIPFLGSTIPYGIHPVQFLREKQDELGDCFTFLMLGRKMTFW